MHRIGLLLFLCAEAAAAPRRDVTTPPPAIAAPPAGAQHGAGLAWQVLVPGRGGNHPATDDFIDIYFSEWSSDGQLINSSFRQLPTPAIGKLATWPEIEPVLGQMTVGEKRRIWSPAGAGYHVYDVELATIFGPHPVSTLSMPPSVDAERSASGLSWLVLKAGDGTTRPELLDQVTVLWGVAVINQQVPASSMPMTFHVRDARYRGLVEAIRDMVVNEKRVVWIPPKLGDGHTVAVELTLASLTPYTPAPPDLLTPPKDRHQVSAGVAYRTLAQGHGDAMVAGDHVTLTDVIWDSTGAMLENNPAIRWEPANVLPEILEALTRARQGERRRIWIAKPSGQFAGRAAIVADVEVVAIHRMFDPLPNGMRIELVQQQLVVSRGGIRAPLPWSPTAVVGARGPRRAQRLISARRDASHGTVELTLLDRCMLSESTVTFPDAMLDARIKNAEALALQHRHQYEAAARGFSEALAADPELTLARANLVAVRAIAGDSAKALEALKPLIAANPALVEWQVLRDPEWASLVQSAEIRALRAATPGTARLATLRHAAAWSEQHHLIAALQVEHSWGASDQDVPPVELLEIRDAKGVLVAVFQPEERTIDRLLAELGFTAGEPGKRVNAPGPERYAFATAKLGLVVGDDQVRLVRGNTVIVEGGHEGRRLVSATLLPHAVALEWVSSGSEGCDGTDPTWIAILPF